MNSLVAISSVFACLAILVVLMPFFKGTGGWLQDAAAEDSVEKLQLRRDAILKRWLDEEQQSVTGMITPREWALRQAYLTSRYVDVSRRLDWLAQVTATDQGLGAGGRS